MNIVLILLSFIISIPSLVARENPNFEATCLAFLPFLVATLSSFALPTKFGSNSCCAKEPAPIKPTLTWEESWFVILFKIILLGSSFSFVSYDSTIPRNGSLFFATKSYARVASIKGNVCVIICERSQT